MSNFDRKDWRAITHFLHKDGFTPTQAAEKLTVHYGDSAPDRSTISRWMGKFGAGRVSLEDDPLVMMTQMMHW
ncbi:MAG: hypothetical protein GY934_09255 [Gammaproteobacteria bacterium]|nr:hypothetical protein [Gammaproteobacteria bacterium]